MKKQEKPPLRVDAARNREHVLAIARELMAQGDASLQLNQVARAAGVGVGTVYRHFPTRQALLEALVNEHLESLVTQARVAESASEPRQGLHQFLRAVLKLQLADVGLAEVLSTQEDALPQTSKLKAELGVATQRLLARAHRAGAIRTDVGVDDVRRLICGVVHAVRIGGEPRAASERYLGILMGGMSASTRRED
ncbi:TetR/AcrR family transcriptional regulator [Myxococcus qinghaiensis]|uniref:TetR/AcrR family transcriptional regulator n=1 Tax=Myxococcus qinghaiensis TaxID=2906758 RepID=UPI0020A82D21|nr:TetR/AcrR family transcriptional regulator [Myxococcus qinghaiensis]MCP3162333.1 TetR/AcrR family transcriptional regulator [Myxococcus qinghaiensis]